ncbi:GlcG/HbpS family heme-binding protein [Enterobacter sp. BNK-13]|uniref:GlcG/HbpS family heme-binding protein n=1 Tax=Enterobacter sp. BNK-13 TaxID=3376150 RepID=UPI003B42FF7A
MKKIMMVAVLAAGSLSLAAQADTLNQKNLSLAQANALATSAIQACTAKNYQVTVTVVDRAGVVKAVQRTDNAGPHTVEASEMKAWTALSAKNASGKVMEAAQSNAGAQNMRDIPGFLLLAGGLPVKEGDEVIGAIGIGGAPGGHFDEACAQAAIDGLKKS